MKATLCIEGNHGERNFSTFITGMEIPGYGIHGYGKDAREAIADTYDTIAEMRGIVRECGDHFPEEDFEFDYVFDVGAFFSYFDYLNISAVAKRIGINASLMRRYATGKTIPSSARHREITEGLRAIAAELSAAKIGDWNKIQV